MCVCVCMTLFAAQQLTNEKYMRKSRLIAHDGIINVASLHITQDLHTHTQPNTVDVIHDTHLTQYAIQCADIAGNS